MPADQSQAQSLELSAGHSYPPRLGIGQKCKTRILDRLPSRFLWLLICRLQIDGFLLGRFICGFSMQKLLLLLGWFLFGFFLRGHGNLL